MDATAEPGFLERAIHAGEPGLLKLWIHALGPERVVRWAAEKDPSVKWEGMYAHRCQACQRLYRDPKIRSVIEKHGEQMPGTVAQTLWLDEYQAPTVIDETKANRGTLDMTR
ncbi:hypothetical protein [Kibdelosporangium phytohabitans]|uniref:Uncharacterized protein n=1 Tax=Kibdelosporangium phytohabitans TaxID=860235 RepID=A0A0N9I5G4_9PSEU|nr:hypothetical protein [Kibdelosporangium phytohabitans]ALG09810.1 hypothetical protein AOZ06_25540 [Kibdelosporangium phytohabitans]MBE1468802.1 hypothetical protein [Kibdelosporangium phytohabitans]